MAHCIISALILASFIPPWFYDHPHFPAPNIITLDAESVNVACLFGGEVGRTVYACAEPSFNTIIVRSDLCPTERAVIMRHEIAHLNGWVHP